MRNVCKNQFINCFEIHFVLNICIVCQIVVKSVADKEGGVGVLVVAEGGNAGEAVVATNEGHLVAKGASGFRFGTYTEVTKRG